MLAQVVSGPTGWIDSSDPRLAPNQGATVVCGTTEGAAAVAVRLWREILFERLHVRQELRPARPLMLREARFQVQAHAQSTHDAYADLLTAVAPQQALNQLDTAIGPTGMTGVVYPDINEGPQVTWLIDYGRTDGVVITTAPPSGPTNLAFLLRRTQSSLTSMMMQSPRATAAKHLQEAINSLTKPNWL